MLDLTNLTEWLRIKSTKVGEADAKFCRGILDLLDQNEYPEDTLLNCLAFNPPEVGYKRLLAATKTSAQAMV